MKIAIITGSVREGRVGQQVAEWIKAAAEARDDATFEIVDLKSFELPVFTGDYLPAMVGGQYPDAAVQAWADAVKQYDAYVIVTPEYNHSIPGGLKNAIDHLGGEIAGKAVAFAGYGADGGVRAVDHLRQVLANFSMYDVRASLALGRFIEWTEEGFVPNERREGELATMLDQLVAAAAKLSA